MLYDVIYRKELYVVEKSDNMQQVKNTSKTIFNENNINDKANSIKESESFKKYFDENIKNIDDVDKIVKNIKQGKLGGVAKEYNKQIEAAKNKKANVL